MGHLNPPPDRIPIEMFKTQDTKAYLTKQKEALRLIHSAVDGPATSIFVYGLQTGDYTVLATDYLIHYTSGSHTVTMIDATTIEAGQGFTIKNSGTGTITVDGFGSQTIDGDLTKLLAQYDGMNIMSDGANWIIV